MEVRSPWKDRLGVVAGLALGAVLLVASWAKLLEPGAFAQQIRLEGLDFWLSAGTVAVIALILETALGMALVLGLRDKWVLGPTTLLVAFFLFLTGRNYWLVSQGLRDPEESCGCFGSLIERTPAEAFWQDLILLVPALMILIWARQGTALRAPVRWVVSTLLALGVGGYVWVHPELKFTDVAAQLADTETDQTFREVEGYRLFRDEELIEASRVFESDGIVGFLVTAPGLPGALFVDPRTREFYEIAGSSLDGPPPLAAGFPDGVVPGGELQLGPDGIRLSIGNTEFRLLLPSME